MRWSAMLLIVILGVAAQSCGGSDDASQTGPIGGETTGEAGPTTVQAGPEHAEPGPTVDGSLVEEDVTFLSDGSELHGVLARPSGPGQHPAIVLVSGSVSPVTGLLDGASSPALIGYANDLTRSGYAVLRYDPPGVGRSSGGPGIETIEARASEAMAALRFLQGRPDIRSDQVGLWGASQGSWVISLAAAEHPADVAFIISVSGAGISVAEQQIWGIESQSRSAGLNEEDVSKAVLFGRLLLDWQLTDPLHRAVNQSSAAALGPGPWVDFSEIVYRSADGASFQDFDAVIEILESVKEEPWADALYLEELYLPRLRSATPGQATAMSEALSASLLFDPKDYLTAVECPVLALFGQDDIVQPSDLSARLFQRYLTAAGNDDATIVTIPDVGHNIDWTNPGYSQTVSDWLQSRAEP